MTLQDKANKLLDDQIKVWDLARKNFTDLQQVHVKTFNFDGFDIKVQLNPARMVSTAAKTDKAALAARKCFLCKENRPEIQQGIEWRDYEVLVNPFPIFPRHFTIAKKEHQLQQILPFVRDIIDLAAELTQYVVFYNGPLCGASAPDHHHFQAGNRGFIPLFDDYMRLKASKATLQSEDESTQVYRLNNYLRTLYCIEGTDAENVAKRFEEIYKSLPCVDGEEPMMNVVAVFEDGKYYLFILPRAKQRPWQYFTEDENDFLLISPGTVEMCGVIITPVEAHFNKITEENIIDIFKQVSL